MTRKEHKQRACNITAYREWSDAQYKEKGAIVVTETDRTPVTIAWGNNTNTTRDDAHSEESK